MMDVRVGYGFDIHRFVEGKPLRLGGIDVDHERGFEGHSDGDILLHALADALLGAAGLGDIGEHFPDTDPRFEGAASSELAAHLVRIVTDRGWTIGNADLTVVMEKPRLTPMKERIRRNVAALLGLDERRVNLKAKTHEGLDAVGKGEAAEAHVVVLLTREEEEE